MHLIRLLLLALAGITMLVAADDQLRNLPPCGNQPRFTLTPPRWPSEVGAMHVTLWADGKIACATRGIDDNIVAEHEYWLAAGEELGLRFTWFVIVHPYMYDYDGGPGSNRAFGNLGVFQRLFDAGHDVQAHGTGSINNLDEAGYERDLVSTKRMLEQIPGNDVRVYAYPKGDSGAHRRAVAARHFIAARGVTGQVNLADRIDYQSTADADWGRGTIDSLLDPDDRAYRGWVSSLSHMVGMGDSEESKAMARAGNLRQLAYVASKRDQLWLPVFREAAMYGQERDSHQLTPVAVTAERISFDLTDRMDDSLFDYPLTVKIALDDGWDALAVEQAGVARQGRIVIHEGRRYALVQAVPDRGRCVVQRIAPTTVEAVEIGVAAGRYQDQVRVPLATITSGATIHYSLDGSEPDASSPVVSGELLLDRVGQYRLRAIALRAGLTPSPVAAVDLEVWTDSEAPRILGASAYGQRLVVCADEALAAESLGGLTLSTGAITASSLSEDRRSIIIEATGLPVGETVVVGLAGAVDDTGNVVAADTSCSVQVLPTVSEDGLVGYWPCDEAPGSTALVDATGQLPPGLLVGAERIDGRLGGGLSFAGRGRGSIATNTTLGLDQSGAFTVSMWCRYDAGWRGGLLSVGKVWPLNLAVHYRGGQFRSGFRSARTTYVEGSARPAADGWFHYAVVGSPDAFTVYVDGVPDGRAAVTKGYVCRPSDWTIANSYLGHLDEIRIYNRALSPDEITALAQPD